MQNDQSSMPQEELTDEQQQIVDRLKDHIDEKEERDKQDPMLNMSDEEVMEILSSGPEVIKKEHFETLQYMCKRPGVVSIVSNQEGTKMPWNPCISAYAVRTWQGDKVKRSKWIRVPVKPGSTKKKRVLRPEAMMQDRPNVERIKLFTVRPVDPRQSKEIQLKNMTIRFSAAKTLLDQIVEGLQEHKRVTPEEFDERLNEVPQEERDKETETPKDIRGGTSEAVALREEEKDVVDETTG